MRERIKRIIHNPRRILLYFIDKNYVNRFLSDKTYISLKYRLIFKKKLNLENPITFNEKIQFLKFRDRNDEYTKMVDKYEVKEYITKKIGAEYVVPLLGVWDKFDDINFDLLPDKFVLKCTHSGGVVVCDDKSKLNIQNVKKKINRSLNENYFLHGREWPYKNVIPRILAEEFVENRIDKKISESLVVYKVFCFDGEPYLLQVIQNDKLKNETIDYFDVDWNLLDIKQKYPNSQIHLDKPDKLSEMLDLSRIISKGRPFLRVDWYIADERLFFSEITFYSDAGFAKFEPEEWGLQVRKPYKSLRGVI